MDERRVVIRDAYDDRTYAETVEAMPALQRLADDGDLGNVYPVVGDLAADFFHALHLPRPELAEPDTLDRAAQVNREAVEEAMGTTAWGDLRAAGTVGDPLAAGVAAARVARRAIDTLTPAQRNAVRDLAAAEEALRELAEHAATLRELADEAGAPTRLKRRARAAERKATMARIKADAAAAEVARDEANRRDTFRRNARTALIAAARELAQLADTATALGHDGAPLGGGMWGVGTAPGRNRPTGATMRERIDLARKLAANPQLGKLAELCGRLRRVAVAVRETRVSRTPAEVVGVTLGADLNRLLPAELGLLADPALEGQFYGRMAERSLALYDTHGVERAGRGPIIVAEDESGSMAATLSADGTTRHLWAKAVALTLCAIARTEQRDLAWLHFAAHGQLQHVAHPWREPNPANLLYSASHNLGGGTDYTQWMVAALGLVRASKHEKADVILLSDGIASPDPATLAAFRAAREVRGMRVYAVLLGARDDGLLDSMCDAVFTLADLAGEDAALRTLFAV